MTDLAPLTRDLPTFDAEHYGGNTEIAKTIALDLSCELTTEERTAKAHAIARKLDEISRLEDRHAEIKATMKQEVQRTKGELSKLRTQEATGFETRPVACHEVRDYRVGMVRTIRLDTGDDVEVRPMHAFERQKPLPGIDADAEGVEEEDGDELEDDAPGDDDAPERADDDDDVPPAPAA